MPDLLTHVLVGYALGTLLASRRDWITPAFVSVVMAGALLPDLNHVGDLVSAGLIHRTLDVPFSWEFLQTGGGVLLTTLAGTLLVDAQHRTRVFGLLWLGAGSHLFLDMLILVPDGRSQSILWPLTQYQPPSLGLYTSADLWPLLVAFGLASATWYVVRYREDEHPS